MRTITIQSAIAAQIRISDRRWSFDSLARRAEQRASVLDMFEASRPACYPLAWGLGTGRLSYEYADALMRMPAREMAGHALRIAATGASVRDMLDAWKAAMAPIVQKVES